MRILLNKNQDVGFWTRRKILFYGNLAVICYTKTIVCWSSYKETHIELHWDGITELTYGRCSYDQRDCWAAGASPANKKASHSSDLTDAKYYESKGTETAICICIYCKCLRVRGETSANPYVFKPWILIKHKDNVTTLDYEYHVLCLSFTTSMERSPFSENQLVKKFRTLRRWIWRSVTLFTAAHHMSLPTLSQIIPLQNFLTDFFKIHVNTTFTSTLRSSN
jgi:hypothetical protein